MDLSIVVPAKNEQGNIVPLIDEMFAALKGETSFEIIYVDDGSTDNMLNELHAVRKLRPQVKILRHAVSTGQSTAILSGVLKASGKYIITMDADGQNDPADIPAFLARARTLSDEHFCIAGMRKKRRDSFSKRLQSRIANAIRTRMLADDTPDTGCGLKLIPRNTFLQLPYFDHMHRFLPALVKRMEGKIITLPVNHRERLCGKSNYTLMSRLWVGVVDLLGVIWLKQRARYPKAVDWEG